MVPQSGHVSLSGIVMNTNGGFFDIYGELSLPECAMYVMITGNRL